MSTSPVSGLLPVPPGVAPHPTGLTDPQQEYIIVSAVLIPISFIALVLRLYTRGFIIRSFGLEDYSIAFSFAVGVGWFVACMEGMKFGFGRHLWDVPATSIPTFMVFFIPLGVLYIWAPTLAKLSTLFLFHRLSSQKYFRWMIYIVAFITLAYTVAGTFVIALACDPTKPENQDCVFNFGNAQSVLNIFTDILMLLLPIPLLRALQMPISQKVVLGIIFSIGSAVVIVSAVRLYFNLKWLSEPDFTWFLAKSSLLSVIEIHCAIICNCLVVLKPLVNKLFPKLLSKSGSSHHLSNSRQAPFSKLPRNHPIELKSTHRGDSSTDHSSSRIVVTKTYRVNETREDSESMEDILDTRMPTHYRP